MIISEGKYSSKDTIKDYGEERANDVEERAKMTPLISQVPGDVMQKILSFLLLPDIK